jgi:uncharacterized repeat protein (TIGR04076 family)
MKRREFMGCISSASSALLTGTAAAGFKTEENGPKQEPAVKCKITVIKKTLFSDVCEKYAKEKVDICPRFKEGQEIFVTSAYQPPEDFCAWAWADIRPSIHSVFWGGRKSSVVCCTDGFRPVIFNVERVEK